VFVVREPEEALKHVDGIHVRAAEICTVRVRACVRWTKAAIDDAATAHYSHLGPAVGRRRPMPDKDDATSK